MLLLHLKHHTGNIDGNETTEGSAAHGKFKKMLHHRHLSSSALLQHTLRVVGQVETGATLIATSVACSPLHRRVDVLVNSNGKQAHLPVQGLPLHIPTQQPQAPLDIDPARLLVVTVDIPPILLRMEYPMEMETEMGCTMVRIHTCMDKTNLAKTERILAIPQQPEQGISLAVPEAWEFMTESRCNGLGNRMRMVDMGEDVDSGVRFVVGHDLSFLIFQAYWIRITE
jgi:hypothetical protein